MGPGRAGILNRDLNIFTFGDLIQHLPFRHEDRSQMHRIADLYEGMEFVQLKGIISYMEVVGEGKGQRLVAYFSDGSGEIKLTFFQGIQWVQKKLQLQKPYKVFGKKPSAFGREFSLVHPDVEPHEEGSEEEGKMVPIYHTTELMKKKGLDSRNVGKLMRQLLDKAEPHIHETLPHYVCQNHRLVSKPEAMEWIHFPRRRAATGPKPPPPQVRRAFLHSVSHA